jgi:hypothetical protein
MQCSRDAVHLNLLPDAALSDPTGRSKGRAAAAPAVLENPIKGRVPRSLKSVSTTNPERSVIERRHLTGALPR